VCHLSLTVWVCVLFVINCVGVWVLFVINRVWVCGCFSGLFITQVGFQSLVNKDTVELL